MSLNLVAKANIPNHRKILLYFFFALAFILYTTIEKFIIRKKWCMFSNLQK